MKDLFKSIPDELKLSALWCCWKYIKNKNNDNIKMPFNPLTGRAAKSNDRSTFVSYPTAMRYADSYIAYEGKKQVGGIGLGIFNGFSAIDIDHCVDVNGSISQMAQEIIDFCNSYTEYSPSGTGIRIIFKSSIKIDKNVYYINNAKNGLEIYISDNTNKFVTITGNKICGDDINEIDLTSILEKYMKRSTPLLPPTSLSFNQVDVNLDDALRLDAKLNELWNKKAPGSHSTESNDDMALCCKLAFYCSGDFGKTKAAFESSPYYRSKDQLHLTKWAGAYGVNTVNQAISFVGSQIPVSAPKYEVSNNTRKTYALNDTGNAHRFASRFSDDVRFNVENKMWMLWNGKFWEADIKDKIRDYVDVLAKEMWNDLRNADDEERRKAIVKNIDKIQNNGGKKALLEECQHIDSIPVLNSDFDNDKNIICASNMVFDLFNQKPMPFDRSLMISQSIGCAIDLENEPVRWLKFLNDIFEEDQEMINYVRKVWAYSLSGSTREQCMWIFYGDGNNGKSLALDILNELMGSYAITSAPELLVDSKNANKSAEEIARLAHKRAIFMEEIKDGDRLNESLVKQMTSGIGKMTGRFLYGNTFELTVIGKILMASNYKPKIKGIDKGIWRRIKLVPLYRDFTATIDKDLREKLIVELPQIAGWLCKGFKLYLEEGLTEPSKVILETKEYKEESDIVQTWINENCEVEKGVWTRATDLFDDFVLWCKKNQENILTQTSFGRNMGKKFKRLTYSTGKVYAGIKLRVQPDNLKKKVEYDLIDIDKEKI